MPPQSNSRDDDRREQVMSERRPKGFRGRGYWTPPSILGGTPRFVTVSFVPLTIDRAYRICGATTIPAMRKRTGIETLGDALREIAPNVAAVSSDERALLLQGPTFAAVDELKRAGLTSASVEFTIRALAADAGLGPPAKAAVDDLATWCGLRYFDLETEPASRRHIEARRALPPGALYSSDDAIG